MHGMFNVTRWRQNGRVVQAAAPEHRFWLILVSVAAHALQQHANQEHVRQEHAGQEHALHEYTIWKHVSQKHARYKHVGRRVYYRSI